MFCLVLLFLMFGNVLSEGCASAAGPPKAQCSETGRFGVLGSCISIDLFFGLPRIWYGLGAFQGDVRYGDNASRECMNTIIIKTIYQNHVLEQGKKTMYYNNRLLNIVVQPSSY